ncbi:MAG TPA: hypothetical protein VIN38_12110 [Thiobacillus sp.]
MCLKTRYVMVLFGCLLAMLAMSWSGHSAASSMRGHASDGEAEYQAQVKKVAYSLPVYADRAVPVARGAGASQDVEAVSSVSGLDHWTMIAATLFLIGMRLWHGGKKSLPLIQ